MDRTTRLRWLPYGLVLAITLSPCRFLPLSQARAESPAEDDQRILQEAELSSDGAALLSFFHARARTDIDREHLQRLIQQFAGGSAEQRLNARMELLGLGPLALPVLRQTLSDADRPQAAQHARRCLP